MLLRNSLLMIATVMTLLGNGCGHDSASLIAEFPLDDLDELLENSRAEMNIDPEISFDGAGSLHFLAEKPGKRLLVDAPLGKIHSDKIVWRAHVKTQSLFLGVYFEFVIYKADGTTRFKRIYCSTLKRYSDWTLVDVVLDLEPGEVPEKLRLITYLDGSGHVWLDQMSVWDGLPPGYVAPGEGSKN